jgi:hypothetical protein
MGGMVQIVYNYSDGTKNQPIKYSAELIDSTCARIAKREVGRYGGVDNWLYKALDRHPIRGQRVAIMGSADQGFGPWYECICLQFGGNPTTIDYNSIQFPDERIQFKKAPDYLKEKLVFDTAFSISSFEHDGLGRYGDPIDPNGDLKAMATVKKLVKKGGILFLEVPIGKDKVVFNMHRIYGRARLPLLLEGWSVLGAFGFEDVLLDRDTGYGWNPINFIKTDTGVREELLHPEYPEYGPIWVLRNDN